jgi:hypothetical protein
MARGDQTKKPAFELWLKGTPLKDIQDAIAETSTTERGSIRGWVKDWERGRHRKWDPPALPEEPKPSR